MMFIVLGVVNHYLPPTMYATLLLIAIGIIVSFINDDYEKSIRMANIRASST